MARPKTSTMTRLDYCQYLLSSQVNYTVTNYAEHVESLSHDSINRYLCNEQLSPSLVWENVAPNLKESTNGYTVFGDSVLDKTHSRHIESVR